MEVRAAAGFDGLTPRYEQFKEKFKKLKIKLPEKERSCSKRSSLAFIDKLFAAYSELKEGAK